MRSTRDGGRATVGIFATTLVMALGLMCCVSIIMSSSTDPTKHMIGFGLLFVFVIYLLFSFRSNSDQRTDEKKPFWLFRLFMKQEVKTEKEFVPRRKKEPNVKHVGSNAPPTVQSIRQQLNHLNTWVADETNNSNTRQVSDSIDE